MEFKLLTREATPVAGFAMIATPKDPEISKMWDRVHNSGDVQRLMGKSAKSENFGLCIMEPGLPEGSFRYLIAFDLAPGQAPDADMHTHTVAGGEYAVFRAPSIPEIGPMFDRIYEQWLPASGFQYDESRPADFEYYTMQGDDVVCDIYVPVVKKP